MPSQLVRLSQGNTYFKTYAPLKKKNLINKNDRFLIWLKQVKKKNQQPMVNICKTITL